ncbi:MAG: FMN reductase [Marmoricola sp.]
MKLVEVSHRSDVRRIAVVSAGLSEPSSTRLLADLLGEAALAALEGSGRAAEVEIIELRPLAHAITDALLTGFPTGDLAGAVEKVASADAVIAVSPVFSASYSGLFKTFFDILEPETLDAMPVLIAATAGSARHSLVLDHALRPLFGYLHAVVVPTGVFAAGEDWGTNDVAGDLRKRVDRAAGELADLVVARPALHRVDPFVDVPDFASLLGS